MKLDRVESTELRLMKGRTSLGNLKEMLLTYIHISCRDSLPQVRMQTNNGRPRSITLLAL